MLPKKIHWLLSAMGGGALMLILSLGWIDQSAARGSIGQPIQPSAVSSDPANLLINPDFENGYSYPFPCCNNVAVPLGWNMRWYTDTYYAYYLPYNFRQPEVKLDDNTQWPYDGSAPNIPPRIHAGRYAVDAFVSSGGMDLSLFQQVGNIPMGAVVTGTAWLQAWNSNCNPFPIIDSVLLPQPAISLQGPNDSVDGSCADNFWPQETNRMIVGIDPYGGVNPRSANVIWNWNEADPQWWGPYDYYSSTLPVTATAKAFTVTLFMRGITVIPVKFDDMYFDSASLTYCCQPSLSYVQDLPWPLSSTVTVTLQSVLTLTQLSAGVIDPNGVSQPLAFLDTIGSLPSITSRWAFNPLLAGAHAFTLTAAELPNNFSQSIDVPILPYSYRQDQIPPPANITFTLYSPISLTNITQVLTDPLGSPTSIAFAGSNDISPTYAFQWTFAPMMTGVHTLDLFADQFVQHWQIPIMAASSQVFLPITLQNFVDND
jgi:hypothetical protein